MLAALALCLLIIGPAVALGAKKADESDVIKNDAFFYNKDSNTFIEPPYMAGKGDWFWPARLAREMVGAMTVDEKVRFATGVEAPNGCHGWIPPIQTENFEFPGLCLADSGNGLRATDFVSSFPSGIHTGASWNRNLTRARAAALGGEFRRKGVNILLGPVVGPLGRIPTGGRNWEGFSNDPYLAGALAYETVQGIQDQGVIASTKHFIANEQETNRKPWNGTAAVSSNVDDRALHELYAWPFQDALRAGTGAIMCSYQRINNSYGCNNSHTLNGLLKTELGFEGFVVSDWDATNAGTSTAKAGLDMAMDIGDRFWHGNLEQAVLNGSIAESRLDDMVHRILAPWVRINDGHDFSEPGHGMPKSLGEPHDIVDARDPQAARTLFDGAVEGHVLVKNDKDTLPLDLLKPNLISIFGYSAESPNVVNPTMEEIDSIAWNLDGQPISSKEIKWDLKGSDQNVSAVAMNRTLIHGGGSGATSPVSFVSPLEALRLRASREGTVVLHDLESPQPIVHPKSNVCFVFGNAWASEGYDRPALQDDHTDNLIKHVADRCERTVVVFHNAGVRLVDNFVDHPNVTVIIFAHLPGEQTGNALTALLYGDENFSGKLPYTVPQKESHYGDLLHATLAPGALEQFHLFPQSDFSEGLSIDYRHFDEVEIQPRYRFGFGLSYTTFKLSNMKMVLTPDKSVSLAEWPSGDVVQGGREDLWDVIAHVYTTIENTGNVAGAEVAQLYLSTPNAPPGQLRGFSKHYLEPGESTEAKFQLTRRDASIWNVAAQAWQLQQPLSFNVSVGTSRGDWPLKQLFSLAAADEPEETSNPGRAFMNRINEMIG